MSAQSVSDPVWKPANQPSSQRLSASSAVPAAPAEGLGSKRLHTRDRHLGNHCGLSVAFSNGFSVAVSSGCSLVSYMFQRLVTFPVDFHWKFPMDVRWHFPTGFHFCDFWCVICSQEGRRGRPATASGDDRKLRVKRGSAEASVGPKDCTPEINTSETIVDFQWHFPMDCQWWFPTLFNSSVAAPRRRAGPRGRRRGRVLICEMISLYIRGFHIVKNSLRYWRIS